MKITFIRPTMGQGRHEDALEPLVFGILAGLTPQDVECVFHDERVEAIPFEAPTDLVALSVDTFSARRAYQIAMRYASRRVPVAMGGFHPSLLPEEALQYAKTIVIGDAEDVWPTLVEDARKGCLQRIYRSGFPALGGAQVDRSIFADKAYGAVHLVQWGRGCRFACDFCSVHAFYGARLRRRPVGDVVAEIKRTKPKLVFFTDDNLFVDEVQARELFAALEPLRIPWACQASVDVATAPGLVARMARSGCLSVTIGFESLEPENLRQMGKSWNLQQGRYEELIRTFREHGIMVYGTFLFGYDADTTDSFGRCLDFALNNRLFLANFNPLTPTPGTPLYTRLEKEGRLIRASWWLHPDYRYGDALFRPRGMAPAELTAGCYWARTEFNRLANTVKRGMDLRANARNPRNAAVFTLANWISRREIHRKQGMALGDDTDLVPVFGDAAEGELACT